MKSEREVFIDTNFSYDKDSIVKKGENSTVYNGSFINGLKTDKIIIKCEDATSKQKQLEHEAALYNYLKEKTIESERARGTNGNFLKFCHKGSKNYLVMQVLGHDLGKIFSLCGNKFPFQSVMIIILRMLDAIEFLHSNSIVHREIKPSHFIYSREKSSDIILPALNTGKKLDFDPNNKIFLIDLGKSRFYEDIYSKKHIAFKKSPQRSNNLTFSSTWGNLGYEMSRRDDLDSLCFIMMYFLRGNLPWENPKQKVRKEMVSWVSDMKLSTSPLELLNDVGIEECVKFTYYVRGLQFDEKPDYEYLQNLLKNVLLRFHFNIKMRKLFFIPINGDIDSQIVSKDPEHATIYSSSSIVTEGKSFATRTNQKSESDYNSLLSSVPEKESLVRKAPGDKNQYIFLTNGEGNPYPFSVKLYYKMRCGSGWQNEYNDIINFNKKKK